MHLNKIDVCITRHRADMNLATAQHDVVISPVHVYWYALPPFVGVRIVLIF